MRKVTKDCEVKLTEQELLELGLKNAKLDQAISAKLQEQRNANGGFRTELKKLRKEASEIAEQIVTGHAKRPVECEVSDGLVNGGVEYTRTDTGERWVEPAKPETRQAGLFEGAAGAAKPAKKRKTKDEELEPDHAAMAKGTPMRVRAADNEEYDLDAKLADKFRLGKTVQVQSRTQGVPVDVLHEVRPPKSASRQKTAAKANGAGEAAAGGAA